MRKSDLFESSFAPTGNENQFRLKVGSIVEFLLIKIDRPTDVSFFEVRDLDGGFLGESFCMCDLNDPQTKYSNEYADLIEDLVDNYL